MNNIKKIAGSSDPEVELPHYVASFVAIQQFYLRSS